MPIQINDVDEWNIFAEGSDPITYPLNGNYELTDNIGSISNPAKMVIETFTGSLNGNDKTIYVEIDEDEPNVGLFSEISGGGISNLIIEGSVTGGPNSLNVGGFAGLITNGGISNSTNLSNVTGGPNSLNVGGLVGQVLSGYAFNCNNLADVECTNPNSAVGGIAGTVLPYNGSIFCGLVNKGSITGGLYVAGIVGRVLYTECTIIIRRSQNAGEIKSINSNIALHPNNYVYIAGIAAYIDSRYVYLHGLVNIARILSQNANFAGGIVAYLKSEFQGFLQSSSNSGIVDGATTAVGGVAGYVEGNLQIEGCINTNWVERGTALPPNAGAIVGQQIPGSVIINCCNDKQMCILNNGIGTNLTTMEMIGYNLQVQGLLTGNWIFENNLYPRPINVSTNPDHPVALLSAAPIYLRDTPLPPPPPRPPFETLDNVQTSPFYVSNWNTYPPFSSPPRIQFSYRWGWYDLVGNFSPNSMMGYISIPFSTVPPFSNIATINGSGSGWDALAVRLTDDNIGYKKVVPINVM